MELDPGTRAQLFKTMRLWLLALVCATVGAYVVWRTDQVGPAIGAFLLALVAFGLPLWAYERRLAKRSRPRAPRR